MKIEIVNKKLTPQEFEKIFQENRLKDMIKFVADIKREVIALGGELHADAEAILIETGLKQKDLWGANYFALEKRIEYTALINIRPADGNRDMEIKSQQIRDRIKKIVSKLLP